MAKDNNLSLNPNSDPDLINRILFKLNPKNWMAEDYSDKKNFSNAFKAARESGESKFLFNNKRYNTVRADDPIEGNPLNSLQERLNNFVSTSDEFLKYYNQNRPRAVKQVDDPEYRANYHRPTDKIKIKEGSFKDLVAELSHQRFPNNDNIILDQLNSLKDMLLYGENRYNVKGTDEYNTHRIAEPALTMKFKYNLSEDEIKRIQKHVGADVDGILGPETYKKISDKYYDDVPAYKYTNDPYTKNYNIIKYYTSLVEDGVIEKRGRSHYEKKQRLNMRN